ncbi:MAG TPA: hypothetical protein VF669_09575 [Tepidisphaeraceae bacterium]|jgi:hypothetical protein
MTAITQELPLDPNSYYHRVRDRTLLTVGAVISYALFLALSFVFSIPARTGFSASLMQQPWPHVVFLLTVVVFVLALGISALITNVVHYEAGFYCACIGLAAFSIRGGPIRYTLMSANGPSIFIALLIELLVLFSILYLGWLVLQILSANNLVLQESQRAPLPPRDEDTLPSQGPLSLVSTSMAMIFLMLLLCQTDRKVQVLASVGLSAFLATLAAHSIFPSRPSFWFWLAPLVTGLLGYICAYFGDGPWTTGDVYSIAPGMAALARPLPLDYATAGPVGALLGYWTSRRWHAIREAEAALSHTPSTPATA